MGIRLIFAIIFVCAVLLASPNAVLAEEKLSGEQIKQLYSDKTFEGHSIEREKSYRAYSSVDGTLKVLTPKGKSKTRYWWVDDQDRHCVSKKKGAEGKCAEVFSIGYGIYKKIRDGEYVHSMKNFVDGNQL